MPMERIENRILLVRGQKVMLDRDLALLYGVTTGNLNKAVSRNLERFPSDFMFHLSGKELKDLIFHSGTSRWGGTRKPPRVFTEQGVAMLSSVLRSERAVKVNIQIMRAFVKIRQVLASHEEIRRKLEEHDHKISGIIDALNRLLAPPPPPPRKKIGFHTD
ncbi:MAG: hypothetical protein A2X48_16260 [Lentisphaerae bacterium GWF2_49_21]|nr:MAG: hypothetical protein A2X48_16260 [Lentisphaerae bacterium GWF2_49_21]